MLDIYMLWLSEFMLLIYKLYNESELMLIGVFLCCQSLVFRMVYDAASVSAKVSLVLSEWSRALASCQIRWLSYGAGKDLMRFSWWGRIRQNGWHLQIRCLVVVWKDPVWLVWSPKAISKHDFLCWLALKNRLSSFH